MTVRILQGDCRQILPTLPAESVHSVVTSPPYWHLRDYQVDGQIGLEATLGGHLSALVAVFEEVRRVLRADGTLWLNYGDMFAGSWGAQGKREVPAKSGSRRNSITNHPKIASGTGRARDSNLKPKDLCLAASRLAILLQEAGWWVRQEIVWHKPNPLPESVTDRPTTAHEKLFLLTKSATYFYDQDAFREPVTGDAHPRRNDGQTLPANGEVGTFNRRIGSLRRYEGVEHSGGIHAPHTALQKWRDYAKTGEQTHRNARSVWTIPTVPTAEAHFATFPPALVERCILLGCPDDGVVIDPFGGAGTVGLVAERLARDSILIELNPQYCEMAKRRITGDAPLLAETVMEAS